MPNVSVYVAVIAGAAGVGGAAISQFAVLARDAQQAKRDRREHRAEAKRQACLDLLQAAGQLRALVASTAQYPGDNIGVRLTEIRALEEAVQLHAASVALAPGRLGEPAADVATAANDLAATAAAQANLKLNAIVGQLPFAGLTDSVAAFREAAVTDTAVR